MQKRKISDISTPPIVPAIRKKNGKMDAQEIRKRNIDGKSVFCIDARKYIMKYNSIEKMGTISIIRRML